MQSRLGQLLQDRNPGALENALARAAAGAELDRIRYFTQRPVFARRLLEALGVAELETELRTLEDADPGRARAVQARLAALRERVNTEVERAFLLYADSDGSQLREEIFRRISMASIDRSYLDEALGLVRRMAKRLETLHSRRPRRARRGRLDLRRTLRTNIGRDGLLFDLRWRRTRIQRPRIIAACDLSGSVAASARFLLVFLFSLTEVVRDVRAFAFSSHLGEVTDLFKAGDLEPAITGALQRYGMGSSDYARSFEDLARLALDDVDRRTTVIVLGDARNNMGPAGAQNLERIYRRAKQVIWLNPEAPNRWDTGDSLQSIYAAYCTRVHRCSTLGHLERIIGDLLSSARG